MCCSPIRRHIREVFTRSRKKYADVREQFGVLIKEIPAVKEMLQDIEISTEASRALVYYTAHCIDMMEGYETKYRNAGLSEREIRKKSEVVKWSRLVKILTPCSKLYAGEECNRNAYNSMQVHGGVGYSEEYDIARIYRDARIMTNL